MINITSKLVYDINCNLSLNFVGEFIIYKTKNRTKNRTKEL